MSEEKPPITSAPCPMCGVDVIKLNNHVQAIYGYTKSEIERYDKIDKMINWVIFLVVAISVLNMVIVYLFFF